MSFFDDEPRVADRGGGRGIGRLNFSLEPLFGITPFVVLRAAASANLTLTTSFVNIVGATVTLVHPGVYLITGVFLMNGDVASNDNQLLGELRIDGVSQAAQAFSHGDVDISTNTQVWIHAKTTLGPTVLQLRGRKSSGTGASRIDATHTTIAAMTVPGSETL